jgi:hypothetical protein
MSVVYLAENPKRTSDIAYKHATQLGNPQTLRNEHHAKVLRDGMNSVRCRAGGASVLASIYAAGMILRPDMRSIRDTLTSPNPAASLVQAMLEKKNYHKSNNKAVIAIHSAVQEFSRRGIVLGLIDMHGRDVDVDTFGNQSIKTFAIDDNAAATHPTAGRIAEQLGTTHATYCKEIVWRGYDMNGELTPILLSDHEHIGLGNVAHDGKFNQIVTVLDSRHPAVADHEIN